MTFLAEPGPLRTALDDALAQLRDNRAVNSLWTRRLDLWSTDPVVQETIANRLGWLDAVATFTPQLPRLHACAASVRSSGFTDVVLLGMGGSSLAPEVLRAVIGVKPGFPRFTVLDSVDPDAVRSATMRPASTLFVVASKSGSTIEPHTLLAEATRRLRGAGMAEPGSHLIAITDDDSPLHRRARNEGFRDIFVNPSDVGGRFSALTFFGLLPAALMGIDVDALLDAARTMTDACRIEEPRQNPGFALGAFMAVAAQAGRDKLTLSTPSALEPFGLWIEQLVAESTGKQGKGVVPIAGASGAAPTGADRAHVRMTVGDLESTCDDASTSQGAAPTVTIGMRHVLELGAEFFRWEIATATAGLLLAINPFDEPNVQQAKTATRTILDTYTATRRVPLSEPDAVIEGVRLTLSDAARTALAGDGPAAFLRLLHQGDYLGLLAYVPPEATAYHPPLKAFTAAVSARTDCAIMFGYGPRYLHSTGQLHKGGPNTGVFIIVTADCGDDLDIPGEPYSFGVLELAQAAGDFESLSRAHRRALFIHFPDRNIGRFQRIFSALLA